MDNQNDMLLSEGATLQLGKYTIIKHLSSGGFGNTYLAHQNLLDKDVAIKEFFMKGDNHRDEDGISVLVSNPTKGDLFRNQLQKFKKEAVRLAKFQNSHIVRVTDLFDENNTTYYAMDYINGLSLGQMMRQNAHPITEEQALSILIQMLDALEEVHAKDLYHLDIKPSNIMLDESGNAILIDFGASKQLSTTGTDATSSAICYSVGYAPAEQVMKEFDKIGPWTDFYALGATFYKILTNHEPPSSSDISERGEQAFAGLEACSKKARNLILWMMQPLRSKRPQNVLEIRKFLSASLSVTSSVEPIQEDESTVIASPSHTAKPDKSPDEVTGSFEGRKKSNNRVIGLVLALLLIISGLLAADYFTGAIGIFPKQAAENVPEVTTDDVDSDNPSLPIPVLNQIDDMVLIRGGLFDMGDYYPDDEDDRPVHEVYVSDFLLSKYEVTQELWETVMGNNPSQYPGKRHPVENVSWNDCQTFIQKLNAETGKRFRLPTEAEWEFAAVEGLPDLDRLSTEAWFKDNAGGTTHDVGEKTASVLGIYDMLGNVAEWCSDYYDADYYSYSPNRDPQGPSSGTAHVGRGGGHVQSAKKVNPWARAAGQPDYKDHNLGFRLAMDKE